MLQNHPMYAYIPARDVARARKFWKVDDLEREMSELRARGVRFEHYEPGEIGGMTMKDGIA